MHPVSKLMRYRNEPATFRVYMVILARIRCKNDGNVFVIISLRLCYNFALNFVTIQKIGFKKWWYTKKLAHIQQTASFDVISHFEQIGVQFTSKLIHIEQSASFKLISFRIAHFVRIDTFLCTMGNFIEVL